MDRNEVCWRTIGGLVDNQTHQQDDPALFSAHWTQLFLTAWNKSDTREEMAGAGNVYFVSSDNLEKTTRRLQLYWDSDGTAYKPKNKADSGLPEFAASSEVWRALIDGDTGPIRAVATGELAYRGPVRFPLRFIDGFRSMFSVAAAMNLPTRVGRRE